MPNLCFLQSIESSGAVHPSTSLLNVIAMQVLHMQATANELMGLRHAIHRLRPGIASKFDDDDLQLLWRHKYRAEDDIVVATPESLRATGLPHALVDHLRLARGTQIQLGGSKDCLTMCHQSSMTG